MYRYTHYVILQELNQTERLLSISPHITPNKSFHVRSFNQWQFCRYWIEVAASQSGVVPQYRNLFKLLSNLSRSKVHVFILVQFVAMSSAMDLVRGYNCPVGLRTVLSKIVVLYIGRVQNYDNEIKINYPRQPFISSLKD